MTLLKGISRTFDAIGNIMVSTSEVVEQSANYAKDAIVEARAIGNIEHKISLTEVVKKVDEDEIAGAMAKIKALQTLNASGVEVSENDSSDK